MDAIQEIPAFDYVRNNKPKSVRLPVTLRWSDNGIEGAGDRAMRDALFDLCTDWKIASELGHGGQLIGRNRASDRVFEKLQLAEEDCQRFHQWKGWNNL